MPKFTRTLILNKTSSHVFQYLSNFDLQKLWIKELVKIEKLDTNDKKKVQEFLQENRNVIKEQNMEDALWLPAAFYMHCLPMVH